MGVTNEPVIDYDYLVEQDRRNTKSLVLPDPPKLGRGKAANNNQLQKAKHSRRDEFYTRIEEVEKELYNYRDQFKDKTVYLNCDDPRWSAFWRYFALNFQHLGIKRLLSTHYTGVVDPGTPSFALEIVRGRDEGADGRIGVDSGVEIPLDGDGDFRSEECINLLKQSDIVVTNPMFSLYREYIAQLMEHDKKFIVLGNINAVTYKQIWPLIQSGKLWFGPSISSGDRPFAVPDSYPLDAAGCWIDDNGQKWIKVKGVRWFTNMDHARRHEELPLWRKYNAAEYPMYDNYDAINVNKVKDIPVDYDGVMGVPITFLDKWNPEQFEIVPVYNDKGDLVSPGGDGWHIDGKRKYARVFVKRV